MSSMQHGRVDLSAIETMDTMMLIFKIIVIPLTTCIHQLWVGSGTYCVIVLCYHHHHHHYYQFMRVRDHDKYFVQNSFGAWWYRVSDERYMVRATHICQKNFKKCTREELSRLLCWQSSLTLLSFLWYNKVAGHFPPPAQEDYLKSNKGGILRSRTSQQNAHRSLHPPPRHHWWLANRHNNHLQQ